MEEKQAFKNRWSNTLFTKGAGYGTRPLDFHHLKALSDEMFNMFLKLI